MKKKEKKRSKITWGEGRQELKKKKNLYKIEILL